MFPIDYRRFAVRVSQSKYPPVQRNSKRNIPTLFIHNHYENQLFDSVEMEDARAAYELTKILIEHGHRRIGGIFKYDDMQGMSAIKDLSSVFPIMA